jgi:hypothetical protein
MMGDSRDATGKTRDGLKASLDDSLKQLAQELNKISQPQVSHLANRFPGHT